jgi:hypothetical protein
MWTVANLLYYQPNFVLEEAHQLLRESLEHDPFKQIGNQPTKKHLVRFRKLLGQEFTFWLAETGNLFFSVLITAKTHADSVFTAKNSSSTNAKNLYGLLLYESQLIMNLGLQSDKTTTVLFKLYTLVSDNHNTFTDTYTIIDTALYQLQKHACESISIDA